MVGRTFNVVPCNRNNSFQKRLINILSLSDMIEIGKLCNLTISDTNTIATERAENECFNLIKWAYLESLSTTTNSVSNPSNFGKPSTKSMVIWSHTGLVRAGAEEVQRGSDLTTYFTDKFHTRTYLLTSLHIPARTNLMPSAYTFLTPQNGFQLTSHGTP